MYGIAVLLTACAPYAEVGIGYKLDSNTYGSSPTAHIGVGLSKDGYSCGYYHWSHIRDGTPFNDNWEAYSDEIVCKVRWGK